MLSDYRAAHSKVHACLFIYLEREREAANSWSENSTEAFKRTLRGKDRQKWITFRIQMVLHNGRTIAMKNSWRMIMSRRMFIDQSQWIAMKSRSIRQTITYISNHGLNQNYVKCVKKQMNWGKKHEVNKYKTEQNKTKQIEK